MSLHIKITHTLQYVYKKNKYNIQFLIFTD